ncbi:uncharacterized protein LOC126324525 [Schistocerca gregaria]|uniref:uncharacterized protein LOC126324525 n=1 Tax=Schistocerca gregaria TaxID=7010 RepID=UPI00211E5BFE|nr:uncharacterized protein LOC126324525 [Schistocerca gregaria]
MARVIVLGGVGFIGRHLVTYLVDNNLASKVAVCDKVLPEVAALSKHESEVFASDKVVYKQVNLARPSSADSVFKLDGGNWDYAINLAATTKYSQTPELYQENIVEVARETSKAAKANNVKMFVHVSTAQVYDSGKKPCNESSKLKPWTMLAKASLEGENEVAKSGVRHVIVRPAIVYGPGDISGITPRLICGAAYVKLKETMEMLWDKSLKLSTVHVRDVVKALWFLASSGKAPDKSIYNLADTNDTDQGSVSNLIAELFNIKVSFLGSIKSKVATTVAMKTVADVANEKHLKPWSDLLKESNISDSPLTPYINEELLYNNSSFIDGSAIKSLGFTYDYPTMTLDLLKEVIIDFEKKGFFPKNVLKA